MAMEYNLSSTSEISTIFEGSCEQAVDCEINLPDYCADILRILKCTVTPCVVSSKISGDRACADGNALMRIIYCDENDCICSVEQNIPFSKYVETGSDNDGALFVSSKAEYVNCRAVSRRKAEIHGTMRFIFKIMKAVSTDFADSVITDGVQTKGGTVEYSSATACECKLFPVNETAELPSDYLPAQRIINTSAVPVLNEAKVIKGKLLLKGEITAGIIYCCDKNAGECVRFDYAIPVNQVVDAAGISDNGFADVCMKISSCDISAREDSGGEQRLFDINLVVSAEIKAYEKKQSSYISDAYSTGGELKAVYKEMNFYKHISSINDTFTCSNSFDFSAVSAQKLCAVWPGEPEIKPHDDSDGILKGKMPVYFILSDHENKPVFCEREFDFEYKIRNGQLMGAPCVAAAGYTYSALADGKTDLKAELIISADSFSLQKERVMISADIDYENSSCPKCGVVVYFPDENEKLWDIARKYGTTEQAIMKENGISDEFLAFGKPLIVPCS